MVLKTLLETLCPCVPGGGSLHCGLCEGKDDVRIFVFPKLSQDKIFS